MRHVSALWGNVKKAGTMYTAEEGVEITDSNVIKLDFFNLDEDLEPESTSQVAIYDPAEDVHRKIVISDFFDLFEETDPVWQGERDDLRLNKTLQSPKIAMSESDWAQPSGYSSMVSSSVNGVPDGAGAGYMHIMGRGDNFMGPAYGVMYQDKADGRVWSGVAPTNLNYPTWTELAFKSDIPEQVEYTGGEGIYVSPENDIQLYMMELYGSVPVEEDYLLYYDLSEGEHRITNVTNLPYAPEDHEHSEYIYTGGEGIYVSPENDIQLYMMELYGSVPVEEDYLLYYDLSEGEHRITNVTNLPYAPEDHEHDIDVGIDIFVNGIGKAFDVDLIDIQEGSNIVASWQGNYIQIDAVPSGSDSEVQFNDNGNFSSDSNFTYDSQYQRLKAGRLWSDFDSYIGGDLTVDGKLTVDSYGEVGDWFSVVDRSSGGYGKFVQNDGTTYFHIDDNSGEGSHTIFGCSKNGFQFYDGVSVAENFNVSGDGYFLENLHVLKQLGVNQLFPDYDLHVNGDARFVDKINMMDATAGLYFQNCTEDIKMRATAALKEYAVIEHDSGGSLCFKNSEDDITYHTMLELDTANERIIMNDTLETFGAVKIRNMLGIQESSEPSGIGGFGVLWVDNSGNLYFKYGAGTSVKLN